MNNSQQENSIQQEHFLNALQQRVNTLLNESIVQAAYISQLEKELSELKDKGKV
jgi:hypothetical protein